MKNMRRITIFNKTLGLNTINNCDKLNYEGNFDRMIYNIINNNPEITEIDLRVLAKSSFYKDEKLFTKDNYIKLFNALENNTAVKKLVLREFGNGKSRYSGGLLSEDDVLFAFNKFLRRNDTLESLILYYPGINNNGILCMADALSHNKGLSNLKICDDTRIEKSSVLFIAKGLVKNKTLKDLNLSINGIDALSYSAFISLLPKMGLNRIKILGDIDSLFIPRYPYFERIYNTNNPLQEEMALKNKKIEIFLEKLSTIYKFKDKQIDSVKANLYKFLHEEENLIKEYNSSLEEYEDLNFSKMDSKEKKKEREKIIDYLSKLKKEYVKSQREYINYFCNLGKSFNENVQGIVSLEKINKILPEDVQEVVNLRKVSKIPPQRNLIFLGKNKFEEKIENNLKQNREQNKTVDLIMEEVDLIEKIELAEYLEVEKITNFTKREGDPDLFDWLNKTLSRADDGYVLISIGSAIVESQQIPNFTKSSKNISILNLDVGFSKEELNRNTKDNENVRISYFKNNISDLYLKDIIKALILNKKKVVLLSNISPIAGNLLLKDTLKENINNYGENFLFINSYFSQLPSIICNKKMIEDYILAESDLKILELLEGIYDMDSKTVLNSVLKFDPELGKIFNCLNEIKIEDICEKMQVDNNSRMFNSCVPKVSI